MSAQLQLEQLFVTFTQNLIFLGINTEKSFSNPPYHLYVFWLAAQNTFLKHSYICKIKGEKFSFSNGLFILQSTKDEADILET